MSGYKRDYGSNEEFDKNMIWDLRQIYAVDILGQTLKDIRVARVLNDYPLWFKLLKRDLATEIAHKLDEAEEPLVSNLIKGTEKVIVKNQNAYKKENCSAEQVQELEEALCRLEKFLKKLMEEHAMFGQKEIDIGL